MNYMLDTDTFSYIMHHHALSVVKTLDEKNACGPCYLHFSDHLPRTALWGRTAWFCEISQLDRLRFCDRLDYIAEWNTTCAGPVLPSFQSSLLKKGSPIGYTDAMIASHAISLDATLVTNNHKHFSNVEGFISG